MALALVLVLVRGSVSSSNCHWPVAPELRAFPKQPFRHRPCPQPPYRRHPWLPLQPCRPLSCPRQLYLQRYRPFLSDCRRPRYRVRRAQPAQLKTFSSHISLAAIIFRSLRQVGIVPLRRNHWPKSSRLPWISEMPMNTVLKFERKCLLISQLRDAHRIISRLAIRGVRNANPCAGAS